ncbi:MAG: trmB [Phycisphaerales bacterium]|nr:trmB [Phycisphaerales bacterium]
MTPRPLPRSAYANKLRDFPDFTFTDGDAFARRGQWRTIFQQRIGPAFDNRIILELGCADASLLTTVAAKHPTTAFIGLDWKCKPLYDAATRITTLNLSNIALLRSRAQDILQIFAEREVDEIWLFHPEPCHSEAELKNRLITEPFLNDVHQVLRDDRSTLSLKTDHPAYYQWVLSLFELPQLRRSFQVAINSADYWNDSKAQSRTAARCFAGEVTTYEARFIKKRQPIYYFEIMKK